MTATPPPLPGPAPLRRAADLLRSGHPAEAENLARQVVSRAPADAAAHGILAEILATLRRHDQALFHAQRASELEAADPARRGQATFRNTLGILQYSLGHTDDAERSFRAAAAAAPGDPRPRHNLAKLLLDRGEAARAAEVLREVVALAPTEVGPASLLANAAGYFVEDGVELLRLHEPYARIVEASARPLPPAPVDRDPDRPLRVGLVSPDLRAHSVASFVEGLLREMDQSRYPLTCYSITPESDEVTARLRPLAARWRDAHALTDPDLAALIRRDAIDILIDLTGLTTGGRPPVFALAPAPVQVSYCGYPASTGLRAIGWRIVDDLTDPRGGGSEAHWRERLVRIPGCHLCWSPPADAPEVSPRPSGGPVRFGSFNALHKLSESSISLWADVLRAVPESTLVLKAVALQFDGARSALLPRLKAAGTDPARVELLQPTRTRHDHLALYGRIDIALDTTPYNGTTTTCEALWMGVPVLTLPGSRHASRVGLSLLTALGLTDLIAPTRGAFVDAARTLAQDPAALAVLRSSLRDRVRASPLCDAPPFARRFEHALRTIWRDAEHTP